MTPARLDTLCDQARAAVAECIARAAAHHAVQIAIAFDGACRRAAWRAAAIAGAAAAPTTPATKG